MEVRTITITGELQGHIWGPPGECRKEFTERFGMIDGGPFLHDWNGIRDALLRITNDGDSQECGILWAYIEFHGINSYGRSVSLGYGLRSGRETKDLFASNGIEAALQA